ncbi:hypothetical protein LRP52_29000 [Photobacterium sp. ZSDE20]|uniref:Uncharacterized protein n=1 Tax=Photobacterium pectinilyticum TaxID=2906793 RepID=A0ABT1N6T9_9GAMM|nr:hypothetical protein [Photobacterium sp. ZSDE20]MCQ1060469.1 hypothetical protein [Photobacterium sp. ZSDE20]MDD1826219.1 hypothetical protein [Photobacterium sp. ZSDE20]
MSAKSISNTPLHKHLSSKSALTETFSDTKGIDYVTAQRKGLGVVCIALVREIIAPASFRQSDPEPLTKELNGEQYICALPNKTKYPERARALQILRKLEIGGALPQNRQLIPKGKSAGDYLDMASFLFGDSAKTDGRTYSCAAAVKYSDAISLQPEAFITDSTFHVRGNESGTLYDEVKKKNSDNLFERVFILPGALMIQILTFTGKVAPPEVVELLLACLASPIAAGGQTSVTGANIRTHVAGIYGGDFESELNSPYILHRKLLAELEESEKEVSDKKSADLEDYIKVVMKAMDKLFNAEYETSVDCEKVKDIQSALIEAISNGEHSEWKEASEKVSTYFTKYFA